MGDSLKEAERHHGRVGGGPFDAEQKKSIQNKSDYNDGLAFADPVNDQSHDRSGENSANHVDGEKGVGGKRPHGEAIQDQWFQDGDEKGDGDDREKYEETQNGQCRLMGDDFCLFVWCVHRNPLFDIFSRFDGLGRN
jgi:hypothetical protein